MRTCRSKVGLMQTGRRARGHRVGCQVLRALRCSRRTETFTCAATTQRATLCLRLAAQLVTGHGVCHQFLGDSGPACELPRVAAGGGATWWPTGLRPRWPTSAGLKAARNWAVTVGAQTVILLPILGCWCCFFPNELEEHKCAGWLQAQVGSRHAVPSS